MLPCAIVYLGCLAVFLEFIERAPVWPECLGSLAALGDH